MSIAFKVFDPILNINDNCSWLPNPNHREIQSKNIEHPWESLWKYSPLVPADIKLYIRVFDWLIASMEHWSQSLTISIKSGRILTGIHYLTVWILALLCAIPIERHIRQVITLKIGQIVKVISIKCTNGTKSSHWLSVIWKKTLFRQWTIFRYTWARKSNTKFEPIMNRVIQIKSKEIKDLRESDGSISIVRVMLPIQNYLMEILLKLNWMIIAQFNESLSDDVLGLVISDYVTFFRWNQS